MMNTYEYRPTPQRRLEKTLAISSLTLAVLCFVLSRFPNVFLPWVLQILGVVAMTLCIFVFSSLLRSFSYRVEVSTRGGDQRDFVIVEQTGKRLKTVCRISTEDVLEVEAVTKENKKEIAKKLRGKKVYRYQAQIDPVDHYLLRVLENEESIYIMISANECLVRLIFSC